MNYEAVLFISFGGPEKREDILPFLEIVTRGRGIPKKRLEEVAHHYDAIGGASPINEITRRQARALEVDLAACGVQLKVYIGQRNWHPFLEETLARMTKDGVRHAVGFITVAHRCEASLERYMNAVEAARQAIGPEAPLIDYVEPWSDHPFFIEAIAERIKNAGAPENASWLFTAHSIPTSMANEAPYVRELERTAGLVADKFGKKEWRLAYSSRSGNPRDPWLEPDVCDAIREEASRGTQDILLVPVGFIADHVEVLFDLDVEAKEAADTAGVRLYRAPTVGDHPLFSRMMADVVLARASKTHARLRHAMTAPSAQRIIVIGGGITGLAAAWRIHRAHQTSGLPLDLRVLEASPRLGGSLQSAFRDGFLLEMGPDCFISDKPRGIGLCRELGLEKDLIETRADRRRSFILRQGKFFPVPDGFYLMGPSRIRPFLESGLLSWRGKWRGLLEPMIPSRPQADESLGSFVRRRFGQEMLDWMAQPLVAGIYGADPENLSLGATFPQFLEMERTYGSVLLGLKKREASTLSASGARYSLFLTLLRGMQTLSDTIAARLGGHRIQCGAAVKEIRKTKDQWRVVMANGEALSADAVCLALPSYVCADLLRPLDPDLAIDLAGIDYAPAATINLAFRAADLTRTLEGIGFVVPQKENRLVLGCTFAGHKFEGRVPEGMALIRAFLGGMRDAAWMGEKEDVLVQNVLEELRPWLGIKGLPVFTQVERYHRSLPQYTMGHLQRILRIEERGLRYRGLSLAGNWQHGVGIPDCIDAGERAAEQLLSYLRRREPSAA